MSDYVAPTWRECASVLSVYLDAGKATSARFTEDERIGLHCIASGLISREEVDKSCPTCGKPRLDYSWWKVTAAGRMLVAAYKEEVARG